MWIKERVSGRKSKVFSDWQLRLWIRFKTFGLGLVTVIEVPEEGFWVVRFTTPWRALLFASEVLHTDRLSTCSHVPGSCLVYIGRKKVPCCW